MRALFASLFLIACNSGSSNDRQAPDANTCPVSKETTLTIDTVTPLGRFSAPPTVKTFSGGASAKVGDSVIWTFAEAVLSGGGDTRSSIFGYSSVGDAWRPWIVVDPKGVPTELVPLTDEERKHNVDVPSERFAIWPTGVVGVGSEALVFYGKFIVRPGALDITGVEGGVAHVRKGALSARDRLPVFKSPDPGFGLGPTIVGDQVYAWACRKDGCVLGRAPLAKVSDRSAWTVWDGSAYNADLAKGTAMITNVPGDLSMSYNGWLRKYLVVHSEAFTSKILIHTADKPEGPWSSPTLAFDTAGDQYAGKEHVALSAPCGESIVITHFARTGASMEYVGELRATSLKLR